MEKFETLKSDQFEKLDEEDVCESVVGAYFGFVLEKKNTRIVSQRGGEGIVGPQNSFKEFHCRR